MYIWLGLLTFIVFILAIWIWNMSSDVVSLESRIPKQTRPWSVGTRSSMISHVGMGVNPETGRDMVVDVAVLRQAVSELEKIVDELAKKDGKRVIAKFEYGISLTQPSRKVLTIVDINEEKNKEIQKLKKEIERIENDDGFRID